MSLFSSFTIKKAISSQPKGQAVLEYVMLLVIALILGSLMARNLLGDGEESKGIKKAWEQLITKIGLDNPESP